MKNIYGFWISPQGEIHIVLNDFGHKQYMEQLLGQQFNDDEDCDKQLFDDGWIRIVNTQQTLMVNYRCITCKDQLKAIKAIEEQLVKDGYLHNNYILDYGYDYHMFDTLDKLLRRIKERL